MDAPLGIYLYNRVVMRDRSREKDNEYRRRSVDRREARSREERPQRSGNQNQWRRQEKKPFVPHNRINEKQRHALELPPKVDRRETCPFLVRVFYSINNQNSFADPEKLPQNEIKLHLWMNSSLRQIGEILRAYLPAIRTKQIFQFFRVHLSEQGKKEYIKQELGYVTMHRKSDRTQEKYLGNGRFCIGDFLDVSINYK